MDELPLHELISAIWRGGLSRQARGLPPFTNENPQERSDKMGRFTVVPHPQKNGCYAIQAPPFITWAKGPGNTFGRYRRKTDAQQRADEHNAAMSRLQQEGQR